MAADTRQNQTANLKRNSLNHPGTAVLNTQPRRAQPPKELEHFHHKNVNVNPRVLACKGSPSNPDHTFTYQIGTSKTLFSFFGQIFRVATRGPGREPERAASMARSSQLGEAVVCVGGAGTLSQPGQEGTRRPEGLASGSQVGSQGESSSGGNNARAATPCRSTCGMCEAGKRVRENMRRAWGGGEVGRGPGRHHRVQTKPTMSFRGLKAEVRSFTKIIPMVCGPGSVRTELKREQTTAAKV